MKRLIIIVEGDSEKEFVNSILKPFFQSNGIYHVVSYKIKHSKGGLSKYEHLKKDIINSIYERDVVITTLIDYYGLPVDFPGYKESIAMTSKTDSVNFLECEIKKDIEKTQNNTFSNLIPYIQLHEFEALVFSSMTGFEALFESRDADFKTLEKITNSHSSPEEINDSPQTAPSKRLLKLIRGYNKVLDGVSIIDEIGLETIREKNPRFNSWLELLVSEMKK
jgi:hypothetical protein